MIRFFGMDPERTLAMPLRLFWSACRTVDRLQAAETLTALDIAQLGAAMGGEATQGYREALRERLGSPTRHEKGRSSNADILKLLE